MLNNGVLNIITSTLLPTWQWNIVSYLYLYNNAVISLSQIYSMFASFSLLNCLFEAFAYISISVCLIVVENSVWLRITQTWEGQLKQIDGIIFFSQYEKFKSWKSKWGTVTPWSQGRRGLLGSFHPAILSVLLPPLGSQDDFVSSIKTVF